MRERQNSHRGWEEAWARGARKKRGILWKRLPSVRRRWRKWKGGRSEPFLKCTRRRAPTVAWLHHGKPEAQGKPSGTSWVCRMWKRGGMLATPHWSQPSMPHWTFVPGAFYLLSAFKNQPSLTPDVHLSREGGGKKTNTDTFVPKFLFSLLAINLFSA